MTSTLVHRLFVSLAAPAALAAALCLNTATATLAADDMSMSGAHGEFGDSCAMGLADGQTVKTDCSVHWIDPDDGKVYCFSSENSKASFLKDPKGNIAKAKNSLKSSKPKLPQVQRSSARKM